MTATEMILNGDRDHPKALLIRFTVATCWLGSILIAATESGICAILVGDDPAVLRRDLEARFPGARLTGSDEELDAWANYIIDFVEMPGREFNLPLDPQGTSFQHRVWQALREIPVGFTANYSEIAERIGAPKQAFAVGEACAANMIAVVIPCHRVVRKSGALAGYRWGFNRKRALLKRERAQ
jgi:AraC family transcriptional regulator, regulatory protein of adaptative response / methylated-DNA-[protein]-cysteine methyltransferase